MTIQPATVSGTFTAVDVSVFRSSAGSGEFIYATSGTYVADVYLERATTSAALSWEKVTGKLATGASGTIYARKHDLFRFRCTAYTSGTVVYTYTPASATKDTLSLRSLEVTGNSTQEHPQVLYIGYNAGRVAPDNNGFDIGIGHYALASHTGLNNENVAVGWCSQKNCDTTAIFNVSLGTNTIGRNGAGAHNTAVGNDAERNSEVTWCVAIGANSNRNGTQSQNVGVGNDTLYGDENDLPASSLTTALQKNVAVGYQAMKCVLGTTAQLNVAVGYQTMIAATTASSNVAVGAFAATALTSGANTTFVGYNSGKGFTTGNDCTFIGYAAGLVATGNGNTILGTNAGNKLLGGAANTIIGRLVCSTTLTTGASNIVIGCDSSADTASSGTSNTVLIKGPGTAVISATGTNATPTTIIGGIVGTTVVTGITAFAGGGQTSATALTVSLNHVTVAASANDSVKLPAIVVLGISVTIINDTANSIQVFGASTSTINNVATATGVALAAGKTGHYFAPVAGKWFGGALA